jgi:hypothetical protein
VGRPSLKWLPPLAYRPQRIAATGGKLPATKSVILRQIHCRLLSLFAARFRAVFFPNYFVRGWCLPKIKAFKFLKAARNTIRLNVSNSVMMGEVNLRF